MALRMINGAFEIFDVEQYGRVGSNNGENADEWKDQTTIECWHKALPSE